MKIFAIYTNVKLSKKPEWLDEYRNKYHQQRDWHITLKQPCWIEDGEVDILKNVVSNFFSQLDEKRGIELTFDKVIFDTDCVMLGTNDTAEINELQRKLCEVLSKYTKYTDPASQSYEENFNPHITIVDNLSLEQIRESSQYFKDGCACLGVVDKVVLSVVNDLSFEEMNKESNKTVYSL